MTKIVIIANDIRSNHNVGSIFRTAEGLGVEKIFLTGYSPYPIVKNENRLPHIATKIDKAISKVSLGAEKLVKFEYQPSILPVLKLLREDGYKIVGLEQSPKSKNLVDYKSSERIGLIIGNEVTGIDLDIIELCDDIVEIPMIGEKESFNVVQAMAIATYHLKYIKF